MLIVVMCCICIIYGYSLSVFAGKVYNMTPYMKFHPGGVDELMRGAGKDCTILFNEVRPQTKYYYCKSGCTMSCSSSQQHGAAK